MSAREPVLEPISGRSAANGGPRSGGRPDAARVVLRVAAALAVLGVGLLMLMILAFALPVFADGGPGGPFSWTWAPGNGRFGILPMLVGSLLLAFSALAAGWPLGLALCCWLLCPDLGGPSWLRALVGGLVRLMTAIPTVVYGFAALFLLTPAVRAGLGGTGMGWLSAGLMLALLILPTVTLVLTAGLAPRLERLLPGGPALGMSRPELLWLVVMPDARGTLASSAVLGFGRAVGDTLLPLMLAGNAPQVPESLTASLRALTAHMALVTSNEVGGAAYNSLFMAGVLLLAVNAAVSLTVRRLERRERTAATRGTDAAGGGA